MTTGKKLRVAVLDMQPIEPATGGGRLRLLGLYHGLGEEISTHYVGSYDWPGPGYRRQMLSPTLEELLVPLSADHFAAAQARREATGGRVVIDSTFPEFAPFSPEYIEAARAAAAAADVVVFSHPWVYPLVSKTLDHARQLIVYDSHNVEALLRMELLDDGGAGTQIVREVIRTEYELCHSADLVLACSTEDRDTFHRLYDLPFERMRVFPNGTFTRKITPATPEQSRAARTVCEVDDSPVALFIGSNYQPNVEAANFIISELAPRLPEVLFVIAGSVGDGIVKGRLPFNVRLPGLVYEEAKHQWLRAADIALNPMFGGSGTNIKMLDYMAAQLPIATTPVGARGIERAGDIFMLAEPAGFHECLRQLLESGERAMELAGMARKEVEKRYSWEQLSPRLGTLFKLACGRGTARPYFSVVVPAPDESDFGNLVDALAGQTFADFETVVVGRGETPNLKATNGRDVQFVPAPEDDLSTTRNIGADITTGRVIAFLGQGCAPEPRWLERAYAGFQKTRAAVLEGHIALGGGEVTTPQYFSPDNLFIQRNAFHALGGFRSDSTDMDWVWRAQAFGMVTAVESQVSRQLRENHRQVNALSSASVGWISSWNTPCGIAEYSRHLLAGLRSADPLLRVSIFCDFRTTISRREMIDPCWTTGTRDVKPILKAVGEARPARLVIQHHPALLPWPSLCDLLESSALQDTPVLITLHNTQETVGLRSPLRSRVAAALKRTARLFVHTVADLERLESLGLSDAAILFPHGGHISTIRAQARPLDAQSAPIIGCFGFFFAHKGIHSLIEAIGQLRGRWPGLRLRLVNAAFPRADSQAEVRRCRETAAKLGLLDTIKWFTDFIEEEQAVTLLSETDLIVLPYAETPESASGALRVALASGTPVAVSRAAIFDEAEGATARLSGSSVPELANSIEAILVNVGMRSDLQRSAAEWLHARRWEKMATGLLHHLRMADTAVGASRIDIFGRSNGKTRSMPLRVQAS